MRYRDVDAVSNSQRDFLELAGQRVFTVVSANESILPKSVAYLVKEVPGQEGDGLDDEALGFGFKRLRGRSLMCVEFEIDDSYEAACARIEKAYGELESA